MEESQIRLLLVGVSDAIEGLTCDRLGAVAATKVATADAFFGFLEQEEPPRFDLAIVGANLEGLLTAEIAQSLRGAMLDTPIFFSHDRRAAGFDRKDYVKNGFSDAFLLPIDLEEFLQTLAALSSAIRQIVHYRSVKIIDIQPDDVLNFDVHVALPLNGKYVRYCNAGNGIQAERVNKLKSRNVGSVFVPMDQMQSFYDYSAAKLKALSSFKGTNPMSETERRDRLRTAVRDLMCGIFSTRDAGGFDEGKRMMEDAGQIVQSFLSSSDQGSWCERVLKTIGQACGSYSHLSNVSTLAALFSMATGIGAPEDLALAGLFHDIGLSAIPAEVQNKPEELWTDDERKIFRSHPEMSLNLVKEKKVILPQHIQTFILQHHERLGGQGYPLGIGESKLKAESQLLGIADEFDELTKFEMGKPVISPEAALLRIKERGGFGLDLVNKLIEILRAA